MKTVALWIIATALSVGVIGAGVYWYRQEQRAAEQERERVAALELQRKIAQLDQIMAARELAKRTVLDVVAAIERAKDLPPQAVKADGRGLVALQRRMEDVPAPPCFDLARTKTINAIRSAAPIFEAGSIDGSSLLSASDSLFVRLAGMRAFFPPFLSSIESAEKELLSACREFVESMKG